MSPAHRMINKGEWGIDVSSNMTYSSNWSPIIPNFNTGIKYGLSDNVNIGLEMSPLMIFVDGLFLTEPYIVINITKQHLFLPRTSFFSKVPLLVTFAQKDAQVYPLIGLHLSYKVNRLQYSLGTELLFNFYQKDKIDLKNNMFIGLEYFRKNRPSSISIESGVNSIGEQNKIYGWKWGAPFVRIGLFRELTKGSK
jgi:hypothetical protein